MFLLKLFCNVPEGSGSWKYNMYFPADEVARKMEYYIVNRGDERKWNKRTERDVPQTSSHPSWDVLSSEVRCRPNVKGLTKTSHIQDSLLLLIPADHTGQLVQCHPGLRPPVPQ